MSLKQELQVWADALQAFDQQDFDRALSLFEEIADTSRVFFNLGLIHATLGQHEQAVPFFTQAVSLDPFLAVGFFQLGVSQFLLGRYEEARKDFDEALLYLRGNDVIDYEQLGLKFKLFSCEVLFNRGLSSIYLRRYDEGLNDLAAAAREKRVEEHGVIDEALADRGEGYTVFSVPIGVLFRPSDSKIKNLEARDYLGQAKVVAASDANDLFVGFSGTRKLATSAGTSQSGNSSAGMVSRNPPLARSQTSAGRLERSGDGVALPLRSRANTPVSNGGLRRSQTASAAVSPSSTLTVPRSAVNTSPQPLSDNSGLPPLRADQRLPALRALSPTLQLPCSPTPPKIYGAPSSRDIIDDYYSNPGSALDSSASTLAGPQFPSHFSALSPTERSETLQAALQAPIVRHPSSPPSRTPASELDRVPTWARQTALPSTPRGATIDSSPALSRENSDASSARSHTQISKFPPPPSAPSSGRARQLLARPALPSRELASRSAHRPMPSPADHRSGVEAVGAGMLRLQFDEEDGDGGEVLSRLSGSGFSATAVARSTSQASLGPSVLGGEMVKVRVKLHYAGDTRGMSISPELPLPDFLTRIRAKFSGRAYSSMRYKDSDESLVSIFDGEDWETAMDQAREAANGRPEGKLEIFLDG
ncbi:hypothetical protein JCM10213_004854 [Rhodosporidiobolus nylandii]